MIDENRKIIKSETLGYLNSNGGGRSGGLKSNSKKDDFFVWIGLRYVDRVHW